MNTPKRRNTIQKKLVLDAVQSLKNHPTAEEVYRYILMTYKNISKGTVYRNLNMLVAEDVIKKVMVVDGADRFDHTITNHNHVKCENCGKVYDISSEAGDLEEKITSQDTEFLRKSGFTVSGYKIIFTGICPNCIKKCQ
ncbi:Fur family transcriptional regulator [Proteocatella sphenisci]|uniref:Fur family transcriptional regulator n=1 Tax=Proteocatella sphenisci TaxID=181070 RepID=UPI00048C9A24|nr:transcriptional repressor [Proteocatella sphenisci]